MTPKANAKRVTSLVRPLSFEKGEDRIALHAEGKRDRPKCLVQQEGDWPAGTKWLQLGPRDMGVFALGSAILQFVLDAAQFPIQGLQALLHAFDVVLENPDSSL